MTDEQIWNEARSVARGMWTRLRHLSSAGMEREDVEQMAAVALLEALSRYDAARSELRPFLRVAVRYGVYDQLRRQRIIQRDREQVSQPRVWIQAGLPSGEDAWDQMRSVPPVALERLLEQDKRRIAARAMRRMTPAERTVARGRLKGRESKAIAAEMGLSQGRVSQLWRSAAEKIRRAA